MKIGIFLPNATFDLPGTPEVGGIETFAFTVGEALQKIGHDVVLYGGKPKHGRQHRATSFKLKLYDYIETRQIPDVGTRFQRLVQRLHFGWVSRHDWLRENFDLILLAKPFDWPLAAYWKRKWQHEKTMIIPKIIMGFHGEDYFYGCATFYKAIDEAFAVSPEIAERARKKVKRLPAIIPNPVDTCFFKPVRKTFPQSRIIVASGRVIGLKGYDRLLKAVAKILLKGEEIKLILAGDGPALKELKQLAGTLNIEKNVHFAGKLDKDTLRNLLQTATLYVQPSVGVEAFSISALEAAACGVPLILSNQVGLAHYLCEKDYIGYPAQDTDALQDAISSALNKTDPAWWDAEARHQRIEKKFSPMVIATQILNLAFPQET
jgi:glycosyltransferase involved in cell wall biosynthesis